VKLRIKEVAEERGKNISDLSHELRMSYSNLWGIWNGKVWPSLPTLKRIADALGCKVADLIDESEPS